MFSFRNSYYFILHVCALLYVLCHSYILCLILKHNLMYVNVYILSEFIQEIIFE